MDGAWLGVYWWTIISAEQLSNVAVHSAGRVDYIDKVAVKHVFLVRF